MVIDEAEVEVAGVDEVVVEASHLESSQACLAAESTKMMINLQVIAARVKTKKKMTKMRMTTKKVVKKVNPVKMPRLA